MRISDWSSDVCSSDLLEDAGVQPASRPVLPQPDSTALRHAAPVAQMVVEQQREADLPFRPSVAHAGNDERHRPGQIDRKSVVEGKSVLVRVALGGRLIIKKKIDIVNYGMN